MASSDLVAQQGANDKVQKKNTLNLTQSIADGKYGATNGNPAIAGSLQIPQVQGMRAAFAGGPNRAIDSIKEIAGSNSIETNKDNQIEDQTQRSAKVESIIEL